MKNLKVSLKLMVSFMIVIVLCIVIGAVGIFGMATMTQAGSDMYDFNVGSIMALGDLRENLALQRNNLRDIFLSRDDPDRVRLMVSEIRRLGQEAEASFTLYETTIFDMSEESDYFKAKDTWFGSFVTMKTNVFALIDEGNFDEAYTTFRAVINDISVITEGLNSAAARNEASALAGNLSMDRTYQILSIVMVAAIILAVATALSLSFYISGLISKPLGVLSDFMQKAGVIGDLTLRPEDAELIGKFSLVKDEIGQSVSSTAAFVSHVSHISEELEKIATGDLTVEVEKLSGDDKLGCSLLNLEDSLSDMFREVRASTIQVNTGAQQVADGAQALAQGSTQQAATVEQLSASISEISEKTKENATMAGRAADLAHTIKGNADKGSRQMDEMLEAVKEINEAGQSISKVIKAIDGIAFQTNILALNAAVEAARAGQHGKGFAVVADEVRSLAAKSAEAAKETEELIANSTEKAELGSRIASETAASLAEIASGINESDRIISEIAHLSEQQFAGIAQINTGIDQVAQVIQQNSATAEESAAASQEMSAQATMLGELVARFKLKEGGAERQGPAYSAPSSRNEFAMSPGRSLASNSGDYGKY